MPHLQDLSKQAYGAQLLKVSCKDHWETLITGNVQIYVPVLVSSQNMTKNQVILESDIEWSDRDITLLNSNYLTRPEDVISKSLKTYIKAGTLFTFDKFSTTTP